MKSHADVIKLLNTRYERQHRVWLAEPQAHISMIEAPIGDAVDPREDENPSAWPLSVPLGNPTEKEIVKDVDGVRNWARSWRSWSHAGTVQWTERQWRLVGKQNIPTSLMIANPEDLASIIGRSKRWELEKSRYSTLTSRWPALSALAAKHINTLVEYTAADFERLHLALAWLVENPAANVFARQLPIPGLDTKWVEARISLLASMLCQIRQVASSGDPYTDCGLRQLPALVRIRILDPFLREYFAGKAYMAVPVEELETLPFTPSKVFIIENQQTGLALPDMPGAVVIMALGYRVECLGRFGWLRAPETDVYYWGDLDTHGFSILHRARQYVPDLKSIMMDTKTLMKHKALWATEDTPSTAVELTNLTESEHLLYTALRTGTYGKNVRFEQEFVEWRYVLDTLADV